jgi:hypothetical protein
MEATCFRAATKRSTKELSLKSDRPGLQSLEADGTDEKRPADGQTIGGRSWRDDLVPMRETTVTAKAASP